MSAQILIPLAAGVEEMEVITIVDILRRADLKVTLAGLLDGKTPVTASRGVRLLPDTHWDALRLEDFDALILPGGMGGVNAMLADQRVPAAIRAFMEDGKTIGAICAAPLVLQAAGVITARRVTAYPGIAEQLTDCKWQNEQVVTDGNIITSRGPGTALEFALALVKLLAGADAEEEVAQGLG